MTYNLYIYPTTSESAYSVVELSAYSALTTLCLFSSALQLHHVASLSWILKQVFNLLQIHPVRS